MSGDLLLDNELTWNLLQIMSATQHRAGSPAGTGRFFLVVAGVRYTCDFPGSLAKNGPSQIGLSGPGPLSGLVAEPGNRQTARSYRQFLGTARNPGGNVTMRHVYAIANRASLGEILKSGREAGSATQVAMSSIASRCSRFVAGYDTGLHQFICDALAIGPDTVTENTLDDFCNQAINDADDLCACYGGSPCDYGPCRYTGAYRPAAAPAVRCPGLGLNVGSRSGVTMGFRSLAKK